MIDVRSGQWSKELLEPLGIPTRLLGRISPAGTVVGQLRAAVASTTGLSTGVKVITPGSHDTASAVAAVPATGSQSWAYLSSGTWSLLGAELDSSCTNAKAQAAMFTNEAGVGDKIRFLKNIAGLWLVQECRRAWLKSGEEYTYQRLAELAANEPGGRTLVNPAYPSFQTPGDMPGKIAEYATATGQPVPNTPGQFVRCCLDSLALAYQRTVSLLEGVLDRRVDVLHIVGGGGQNRLRNQLAANMLERPVVVGPLEATAIGNGLVQAMACGELKNLEELRSLIAGSDLIVGRYEPQAEAERNSWQERFQQLVK
jgi:rhamnulokinase